MFSGCFKDDFGLFQGSYGAAPFPWSNLMNNKTDGSWGTWREHGRNMGGTSGYSYRTFDLWDHMASGWHTCLWPLRSCGFWRTLATFDLCDHMVSGGHSCLWPLSSYGFWRTSLPLTFALIWLLADIAIFDLWARMASGVHSYLWPLRSYGFWCTLAIIHRWKYSYIHSFNT